MKFISVIILSFFLLYSLSSVGLIQYKQKTTDRHSFNEGELTGFNFIYKNIPYESQITSDELTTRYLMGFVHSSVIEVSQNFVLHEYVVIPKKQFLSDGLTIFKGSDDFNPQEGLYSYFPTNENIRDLYTKLYTKNQIYSSDFLEIYNG